MTEPVRHAEKVRLSLEERATVVSIIGGIERGIWKPTPAMKRFVAQMLQRLLWATQYDGGACSDGPNKMSGGAVAD